MAGKKILANRVLVTVLGLVCGIAVLVSAIYYLIEYSNVKSVYGTLVVGLNSYQLCIGVIVIASAVVVIVIAKKPKTSKTMKIAMFWIGFSILLLQIHIIALTFSSSTASDDVARHEKTCSELLKPSGNGTSPRCYTLEDVKGECMQVGKKYKCCYGPVDGTCCLAKPDCIDSGCQFKNPCELTMMRANARMFQVSISICALAALALSVYALIFYGVL